LIVILYELYQLWGHASGSLNLLCLGPERKINAITSISSIDVFYTEEHGHGRMIYNSRICVKGSTYNEFEDDYYKKLEEVNELQYHSEFNRAFLFKFYCYDTNRGIGAYPHQGLVKINA